MEKEKLSRYTYIFSTGLFGVLYNTKTDAVLQLENALIALMEKHQDDMRKIQEVHPSLYAALCENNFLVSSETDEAALLEKEWKEELEKNHSYKITINPTLNCNCRCWYCYENHTENRTMTKKVFENTKKYLRQILQQENLRHLQIEFFGGEPLLRFHEVVLPIISEARALCADLGKALQITFTTNGYLLDEEKLKMMADVLPKDQLPSFQITFDGNEQYHNKTRSLKSGKETFSSIIKNIKAAIRHGFSVHARCNYTHENVYSFIDLIDDFSDVEEKAKQFLSFDFHKVWQEQHQAQTEETLKEVLSQFQIAGLTVLPRHTFNKHFCYADTDHSFTINYDGRIYKCTAREFIPELAEGKLSDNGTLEMNQLAEQRKSVLYKNKTCKHCKIYPICHGGCSQDKLEYQSDTGCLRYYDEAQKEEIAFSRLEYLLRNNKNEE